MGVGDMGLLDKKLSKQLRGKKLLKVGYVDKLQFKNSNTIQCATDK